MKTTKYILSYMAATLMLLLGACSSETEVVPDTIANDTTAAPMGTVTFSLEDAVDVATTRADYETDQERRVSTLLAVAFTAPAETAAIVRSEDDDNVNISNYVCASVVDVLGEGYSLVEKNKRYSIRLFASHTDDGSTTYQICFVANPSTDLRSKIEAMAKTDATNNTVSDFEKLIETQDPSTKPMLMVSNTNGKAFQEATVVKGKESSLGTIKLRRIMARIDIINRADGAIITKVELKNRAIRSQLISNNATPGSQVDGLKATGDSNDSYLKDETYSMNLIGNSTTDSYNNSCEATIYSYEQYEEASQDATVTGINRNSNSGNYPELVISYKLGGNEEKTYEHTVKFHDASGTGDGTAVPLARNHIYRVIVTGNNSTLTFSLTVADWNDGSEIEVSRETLSDGLTEQTETISYDKVALGDVMIRNDDGTIDFVSAKTAKEQGLSDTQKKNAIGIVAYLFDYGNDEYINRLATYRTNSILPDGKDPTGLVMALKNVGGIDQTYEWRASTATKSYTTVSESSV